MMKSKILISLFVLIFLNACNKEQEEPSIAYSFFVAGHVYGNPMTYQYGVHPALDSNLTYLNNYPNLKFGIFTGDVVPIPTADYWDSLQADLNRLSIPYYIAPGNHDRGQEFTQRYHDYYQTFNNGEDLFITLSPSNWNIENEQLEFLQQTLNDNQDTSNTIFIFCHELIWWSPENIFNQVDINYTPHYPGSSNYWEVIDPLLRDRPNKVVLFAGDVGCNADKTPCMYYEYDNITLIASGMGSGDKDNLIICDVLIEGSYQFNLIHLDGNNKKGMGDLEDYTIE
jgi:hypothetical protein